MNSFHYHCNDCVFFRYMTTSTHMLLDRIMPKRSCRSLCTTTTSVSPTISPRTSRHLHCYAIAMHRLVTLRMTCNSRLRSATVREVSLTALTWSPAHLIYLVYICLCEHQEIVKAVKIECTTSQNPLLYFFFRVGVGVHVELNDPETSSCYRSHGRDC